MSQSRPSPRESEPQLFRLNKHYRVYKDGRIESELKVGRPRKGQTIANTGPWHPVKPYLRGKKDKKHMSFSPRIGDKVHPYPVAFAVLMAYGPPRPSERSVVRYRDGNPENCHIDNLYWNEPEELPEEKEKSNLEEWTLLYMKVREGTIAAEEICRQKSISLAECIVGLRKGKREHEHRCRSEAQKNRHAGRSFSSESADESTSESGLETAIAS